jgi:hypothetical protein
LRHSAQVHYAEFYCAECRNLFIVMLNVVLLSVVMLNVIMLSVVMLSVVAPVFHYTLLERFAVKTLKLNGPIRKLQRK